MECNVLEIFLKAMSIRKNVPRENKTETKEFLQ